jgi:hypothetical protein
MLVILVLETACGKALCAFRHGEPSRASPNFVLSIPDLLCAQNNDSHPGCLALQAVSFSTVGLLLIC